MISSPSGRSSRQASRSPTAQPGSRWRNASLGSTTRPLSYIDQAMSRLSLMIRTEEGKKAAPKLFDDGPSVSTSRSRQRVSSRRLPFACRPLSDSIISPCRLRTHRRTEKPRMAQTAGLTNALGSPLISRSLTSQAFRSLAESSGCGTSSEEDPTPAGSARRTRTWHSISVESTTSLRGAHSPKCSHRSGRPSLGYYLTFHRRSAQPLVLAGLTPCPTGISSTACEAAPFLAQRL